MSNAKPNRVSRHERRAKSTELARAGVGFILHIPGQTLRERATQAMLERIEADMTPYQRMMRDAIVEAAAYCEMFGGYRLVKKVEK